MSGLHCTMIKSCNICNIYDIDIIIDFASLLVDCFISKERKAYSLKLRHSLVQSFVLLSECAHSHIQ